MSEQTQMGPSTEEITPTMPPAARRVALRLLGAPVIYSVYFLIAYFLVEIGCGLGFLQGRVAGMPALTAAVLALTVVALAAILAQGLPGYRQWRRARVGARDETGGDTQRFASGVGVWLTLLFLLVTLLTGIAEVVLSRCRWA
ncbi:MAG: hypothetical protein DCC57_01825 [Chloroflexi bacterium]|nr:MAG: hypothetical protein DCC57_01825 [Chloroflexota bacterium]